VSLLTTYNRIHTLEESVDDPENLRCVRLCLISCEPVEPLQYHLDVGHSIKLLDRLRCVVLSKVTSQRVRTYSISQD
jgi:hypothetical protein